MEKGKYIQSIQNLFEKAKDYAKPSECRVTQLKKRIVSSLILVPFAIYAILFSKSLFMFFAISLTALMVFEWCDMTQEVRGKSKWRLVGFLYIVIPVYCLVKIRLIDENILFWMFLVIWSTDIAAYFTGKILGGPKLAPEISPGKTWSGFFGGIAAAIVIGLFSSLMFVGTTMFFVVISVVISIISQASDLLESRFKRLFGVKDSSHMIPGHGGVLDRLDGIMLVAPFVLMVIYTASSQFGAN